MDINNSLGGFGGFGSLMNNQGAKGMKGLQDLNGLGGMSAMNTTNPASAAADVAGGVSVERAIPADSNKIALDDGKGTVGEAMNSFGDMLKQQMDEINAVQAEADSAVQTYATGGNIELHNVITAVEKADMALQLAVQVRNRLVSAYQEVSRMNV